jgi:CHAT domain-containing protein
MIASAALALLAFYAAVQSAGGRFEQQVRSRPDSARDRIQQLLAAGDLREAAELADAYAAVWRDSFPARSVRAFQAASATDRARRVRADSLRLAGNRQFERHGPDAALQTWRRSLNEAAQARYTAGVAAALGNIGSAFYLSGELDSAARYLDRTASLALGAGDSRTAANAVGTLGGVARDRGELGRAAALYARASGLRASIGDSGGLAADENNVGLLAEEAGDLAGATRAYARALALNRRRGSDLAAATNLVNLANIRALQGEYDSAFTGYRQALAIYDRLGSPSDRADTWYNIGLLEGRRGQHRRAIAALRVSGGIGSGQGAAVHVALAHAHAAAGDLGQARHEARAAQAAVAGGTLAERADVALAAADLALQVGDAAGAERGYAASASLYREAGHSAGIAASLEGAGMLELLRRRPEAARRMFDDALRARVETGDRRATAVAGVLLGEALLAGGNLEAARASSRRSLATFTSLHDVAGQAMALDALGRLDLAAGMPAAAASQFRRGLARLGTPHVPAEAWRLQAGLGAALAAQRDVTGAIGAYRIAAELVEQTASTLPDPGERLAYLGDKSEVYAGLAASQLRHQPGDAFATSERMRARQLRLVLALGSVRASGAPAGLARREEALRFRLDALARHGEIDANDGVAERGGRNDEGNAASREALAAARREYASVLRELRASQPRFARLVDPQESGWREIARAMPADEALLEFLIHDSTTVVFAVTRDTVQAFELRISQRALAQLVDFAREMMRPAARLGGWSAPLSRLYDLLLRPVADAGLLAGKRSIVIVPHAELHYLPFAALVTNRGARRFLVEDFDVSYSPSASLWLGGSRRAGGGPVVALAPHPARLPGSRAEVEGIGALFGRRATVLIGTRASEVSLRALAPRASILHLATYGVLNRHNPLFSYVDLAASGADNGRLEVHEVFDLPLTADLVVLSACETSLGAGALRDVPAGDDWVSLMTAFVQAGAGSVVATAWPVQDGSTARLMEHFYLAIRSGDASARALGAAQRAMLRNPGTRDPYHWAAFMLTSGGRT